MTNQEWTAICYDLVDIVKSVAPVDKGNLKNYGVTYAFLDNDTFEIKIDLGKAPYMPYTNEPWIAKRWNGKKNPNEGWWQKAVEKVVQGLASAIGGEVK